MAGLVVVWRIVQNYVNSPRIMGKTLELHPLTVIVALMVGAQVGGIAGVYIAYFAFLNFWTSHRVVAGDILRPMLGPGSCSRAGY